MAEKKTPRAQQIVELLTPLVGKPFTAEILSQVKSIAATIASGGTRSTTALYLANEDGSRFKDKHDNPVAIALRDFYYQYGDTKDSEICWALPHDFGQGHVKAPQGVQLVEWRPKASRESNYSEMSVEGTRRWTNWYNDIKGKKAAAQEAFDKAFNDVEAMKTPAGLAASRKANDEKNALEKAKPVPVLEGKPAGFMTLEQVKSTLEKAKILFTE